MQQAKPDGIKVIARAAEVLRVLENEPGGLSLAQISRRTQLARSTVHRIVGAMQAESLVIPASPRGSYRLGPELTRLARTADGEFRQTVRPYIERLARGANEAVDLAVLNRDQVYFVDQVTVPNRLQAVSAVGESFPAHCTANGKALLASLAVKGLGNLLPRTLPSLTPNTIINRDRLLEELEGVRKCGYAFDREEHTVGICAVGATIHAAGRVIGAVSIPVPSARFADREESLAGMLLDTCAEISSTLGNEGLTGNGRQGP